jgi:hypothetical protein
MSGSTQGGADNVQSALKNSQNGKKQKNQDFGLMGYLLRTVVCIKVLIVVGCDLYFGNEEKADFLTRLK